MKKLVCILMAAIMLTLCGCSESDSSNLSSSVSSSSSPGNTAADYTDAASFEAALNRGENVIGKTVTFTVKEVREYLYFYLHPTKPYNLIAGEHLNFVTPKDREYKAGEEVTVKVTDVVNYKFQKGSWIINDPLLENYLANRSDYPGETNNTSDPEISTGIYDDSSAAEPKVPEKSFSSFTVSGTGSKVTKDISLPPVLCVVHAEHSGSRNFIVDYYSASGYSDMLSNEIGAVNSYQIYDATGNGAAGGGMLDVNADGRWSITFIPLADYVSSSTKTSFSGRGNAVVGCFTANGVTVCKGTHRGDHNFIVDVYEYSETGDRLSLAFNEIGTYSGETVLRTEAGKKYFFNVG